MGLLSSTEEEDSTPRSLQLSNLEHRIPMPRSLTSVSNLEIRDLNRDQVRFYHPGYLKPLNLLFCLPRVDYEPLRGAWGVHFKTALTACQIIANNAFGSGRLARDAEGKDVVSDEDQILLNRDYWFFVDGEGMLSPPRQDTTRLTCNRTISDCSKL